MNFSVYLLAKWNTMVYNVLDYIFHIVYSIKEI